MITLTLFFILEKAPRKRPDIRFCLLSERSEQGKLKAQSTIIVFILGPQNKWCGQIQDIRSWALLHHGHWKNTRPAQSLDGVCSKYGAGEFLDHIDYLATRLGQTKTSLAQGSPKRYLAEFTRQSCGRGSTYILLSETPDLWPDLRSATRAIFAPSIVNCCIRWWASLGSRGILSPGPLTIEQLEQLLGDQANCWRPAKLTIRRCPIFVKLCVIDIRVVPAPPPLSCIRLVVKTDLGYLHIFAVYLKQLIDALVFFALVILLGLLAQLAWLPLLALLALSHPPCKSCVGNSQKKGHSSESDFWKKKFIMTPTLPLTMVWRKVWIDGELGSISRPLTAWGRISFRQRHICNLKHPSPASSTSFFYTNTKTFAALQYCLIKLPNPDLIQFLWYDLTPMAFVPILICLTFCFGLVAVWYASIVPGLQILLSTQMLSNMNKILWLHTLVKVQDLARRGLAMGWHKNFICQ